MKSFTNSLVGWKSCMITDLRERWERGGASVHSYRSLQKLCEITNYSMAYILNSSDTGVPFLLKCLLAGVRLMWHLGAGQPDVSLGSTGCLLSSGSVPAARRWDVTWGSHSWSDGKVSSWTGSGWGDVTETKLTRATWGSSSLIRDVNPESCGDPGPDWNPGCLVGTPLVRLYS